MTVTSVLKLRICDDTKSMNTLFFIFNRVQMYTLKSWIKAFKIFSDPHILRDLIADLSVLVWRHVLYYIIVSVFFKRIKI